MTLHVKGPYRLGPTRNGLQPLALKNHRIGTLPSQEIR